MPLYEYQCGGCGSRFSVFVRSLGSTMEAQCDRCGSAEVTRTISSFAYHRSLDSRLDNLDPKYDKMLDASNADIRQDTLFREYGLDEGPMFGGEGPPERAPDT